MENVDTLYTIENLEQLRALADPLRTRVLEELVRQPMTTSQLADQLGETNNKMHYHVHELERFGLIKLVEKREKGGALEKYYRAVARTFTLAPALLQPSVNSDITTVIRMHFDQIIQGVVETFERRTNDANPNEHVNMNRDTLWMTDAEYQTLVDQFNTLIESFTERRNIEGERPWGISFVLHTAPVDKESNSSED